jgi:hypothetical protein
MRAPLWFKDHHPDFCVLAEYELVGYTNETIEVRRVSTANVQRSVRPEVQCIEQLELRSLLFHEFMLRVLRDNLRQLENVSTCAA